ncbi:MAG: hypothetical protein HOA58_13235, partial [Rhodospirillaceae bacterium]|nr:hypothetical protein [Rhodospirillaceae bacterium]
SLFRDEIEADVEVLNLAVPAGNSQIDYNIIGTYGVELDIDSIVFVTGHNDINGTTENIRVITEFSTEFLRNKDRGDFMFSMFTKSAGFSVQRAIFHIKSLQWLIKTLGGEPAPSEVVWVGERNLRDTTFYKKNISEYLARMKKIYKATKHLGMEVFIFHQPTLRDEINRRERENIPLTTYEIDSLKWLKKAPFWEDVVLDSEEIISEADYQAREFGYRYYGMNDVFDNHKGIARQGAFVDPNALYVSWAHWTETGARLVAERIFHTIKDQVRVHIETKTGE